MMLQDIVILSLQSEIVKCLEISVYQNLSLPLDHEREKLLSFSS